MRLTNVRGRASLLVEDGLAADVEELSDGRFATNVLQLLDHWEAFRAWQSDQPDPWIRSHATPFSDSDLDALVAEPRQIFAVGLNYRDHGRETGYGTDVEPVFFTKFASSLCGPYAEISLPSDQVDWEAELVVVVGRTARAVPHGREWEHIAGLTLGQDLSERRLQFAAPPAQFSLAKSFENFSPIGPWLITPDELDDPADLELTCLLNGETVQQDRTSNMIHSIPELIRTLSAVVELRPGDLLFTGTPAGVGMSRTPPRYFRPGDTLVTRAAALGELRLRFVARPEPAATQR